MYDFDYVLSILFAPFKHFLEPWNRLSYIYMGSALLIAIASYIINQARKGELQSSGLIKWLLPKDVLLHKSSQADFAYFLTNKILQALIYGSLLITVGLSAAISGVFIELIFGPPGPGYEPSLALTIFCTITIILVLDFFLWLMHYLFHIVPFLWDYHKVHHSAEVMTPITASRMHPVEEILDATVATIFVGLTHAILDYTLGPAADVLTIFEINIILAAFYLAAFNLRHSHVWIRYPYWLQHIFVCPAQHQIHHSVEKRHWDKNMGFIFSFWDWIAGTLYAPKEKEEITYGLGTEEDGGAWHSVGALYFRPFRQSLDRWKARSDGSEKPEPSKPSK